MDSIYDNKIARPKTAAVITKKFETNKQMREQQDQQKQKKAASKIEQASQELYAAQEAMNR